MRRREFLAGLGTAAGAAWAAGACTPGEPPLPAPLTVALSDLPDGRHHTVLLAGKPIDVIRVGRDVTAWSLVCPHTGCLVRWSGGDERYHCACHDGLFDKNGLVIGGQADRPLTRLVVRVEEDLVTINPPRHRSARNTG